MHFHFNIINITQAIALGSRNGTGTIISPTGSPRVINGTSISNMTTSITSTGTTSPLPSSSSIPVVPQNLNFSLPYPYNHRTITSNLQSIAIVIGSYCGSDLQHSQSISTTIAQIAELFITTNGNATRQQIASVAHTTELNVAWMTHWMSGNQSFQQLQLWASKTLAQEGDLIPTYKTNLDTLSLVVIFMAFTILTTAARLYSRRRHGATADLQLWVDGLFLSGVLVALGMTGLFGNGKLEIVDFFNSTAGAFLQSKYPSNLADYLM